MQTVSSRPLYEQVAERLGALIREGVYEPGERLPSIRVLSRQMSVSVNTVREAYSLLESRRVVTARSQSGYYVFRVPETPQPDAPSGAASAGEAADVEPRPATVDQLTYAVLADAENQELVPLSLAIPPVDLLPREELSRSLRRVAREDADELIRYSISPGHYELRAAVSRRLSDAGCIISPDEVIATAGCLEGVMLALRATTRPGDTVALESPTFYLLIELLQELELEVIEIPSDEEHGMDLELLQFVMARHNPAAILVIPNFNNPTGALMPEEHKRRLAAIAAEHEVPVIEDDIYGELSFETPRPNAIRAYDSAGQVILCSSFSKTIAPGFRVGFIAAGRYSDRVQRLKSMFSVGISAPSALAVTDYLESGRFDRYLRSVRRHYRESSERIAEAVESSFPEGTFVHRPQGGLVLWVSLPPGVDAVELYNWAREQGIAIAPGRIFSVAHTHRNSIRLNATSFTEPIAEGIAELGRLAAALDARRSAGS
jgi:DNA-binding transcriptional MocR family regulator